MTEETRAERVGRLSSTCHQSGTRCLVGGLVGVGAMFFTGFMYFDNQAKWNELFGWWIAPLALGLLLIGVVLLTAESVLRAVVELHWLLRR